MLKGGRHGYTAGWEIKKAGGVVASVLAGGRNPWPSAKSSGSCTPDFVGVVRGCFPQTHHVSRLDSCIDFDYPGAFDQLALLCELTGAERGLKRTFMQSSGKNGNEGRTFYIGSPSSDCRVRLYEKGHEMVSKFPGRAAEFSLDHVRIEMQGRPQDIARISAAAVTPDEAWGLSQTARLVARRCLGRQVDRIAGSRHDLTDLESSADHLALQYRKTVMHLFNKAGDPANFTGALFNRIERVKDGAKLIKNSEVGKGAKRAIGGSAEMSKTVLDET